MQIYLYSKTGGKGRYKKSSKKTLMDKAMSGKMGNTAAGKQYAKSKKGKR